MLRNTSPGRGSTSGILSPCRCSGWLLLLLVLTVLLAACCSASRCRAITSSCMGDIESVPWGALWWGRSGADA